MTSTLEEWIGTPQEAINWVVLILLGKAGWNLIDNVIPPRRKGSFVMQQQEQR